MINLFLDVQDATLGVPDSRLTYHLRSDAQAVTVPVTPNFSQGDTKNASVCSCIRKLLYKKSGCGLLCDSGTFFCVCAACLHACVCTCWYTASNRIGDGRLALSTSLCAELPGCIQLSGRPIDVEYSDLHLVSDDQPITFRGIFYH